MRLPAAFASLTHPRTPASGRGFGRLTAPWVAARKVSGKGDKNISAIRIISIIPPAADISVGKI